MRPIATDVVASSVIRLYVTGMSTVKNGRTDQDAVWHVGSGGLT